jgi:GWxTD domain-containing protein
MNRKSIGIFIIIVAVGFIGCGPKKKVILDPQFDSFFEKARLIMSKEELAIYKHLPDSADKEAFIKEFWEKRDPTPETEENENRLEFQERIAYANRWFKEGKSSDSGWDTERGRILLQLGFPSSREWGEYTPTNPRSGQLVGTKRYPMEIWRYYEYQLTLTFVDLNGFGKLRMIRVPATLLTALDMSKFTLDLREKTRLNRAFKFTADFMKDVIQIEIPVKKLSFEENGNQMTAKFKIDVYVYHDYKKIEKFSENKTVNRTKNELLTSKTLNFKLPFKPEKKGHYYFDIIVEEVLTASKYRNFCSHKN